ncbi:hypothetical protein [Thauera sp.]|uniref:hypothetical protein n=1 Tax=Thauera sp. TaxID=1905334 RepID=UPI0039E40A16
MDTPAEQDQDQDGLAQILPQVVGVKVAGREVQVGALTLGELPPLMALLRRTGMDGAMDPMRLLVEQPDVAIEAVALLTRQPQEEIEAMVLDDVAALLYAAIEANRSFFVRYGPLLLGAVERMLAGVGRLSSPG